jgi:hypothetical protein
VRQGEVAQGVLVAQGGDRQPSDHAKFTSDVLHSHGLRRAAYRKFHHVESLDMTSSKGAVTVIPENLSSTTFFVTLIGTTNGRVGSG